MEDIMNPIAQIGSLKLYPDHVVQTTPTMTKFMALSSIQFCRWHRHRHVGLVLFAVLCAATSLVVLVATFDNGPLYATAIWASLAASAVILFTAYRALQTSTLTIRGEYGVMFEFGVDSRATAQSFIDALIRTRRDRGLADCRTECGGTVDHEAPRNTVVPGVDITQPIEGII